MRWSCDSGTMTISAAGIAAASSSAAATRTGRVGSPRRIVIGTRTASIAAVGVETAATTVAS